MSNPIIHYSLSTIHTARRAVVWLRRIRHRRGYGIHSPFAFNLVTEVIYNRQEYYAYAPLKQHFRLHGHRLKTAKLLFRLSNDIQPDRICLFIDVPEAEQAYLQAGCMKAEICKEQTDTVHRQLIIDDGTHYDHYLPTISPDDVLIILNLLHNKKAFKAIQQDEQSCVTFDLYDLAIVFFNHRLTKQHYIINF